MDDITIKEIKEIRGFTKQYSKDIRGWKLAMHKKAVEMGITDKEILEINRIRL